MTFKLSDYCHFARFSFSQCFNWQHLTCFEKCVWHALFHPVLMSFSYWEKAKCPSQLTFVLQFSLFAFFFGSWISILFPNADTLPSCRGKHYCVEHSSKQRRRAGKDHQSQTSGSVCSSQSTGFNEFNLNFKCKLYCQREAHMCSLEELLSKNYFELAQSSPLTWHHQPHFLIPATS